MGRIGRVVVARYPHQVTQLCVRSMDVMEASGRPTSQEEKGIFSREYDIPGMLENTLWEVSSNVFSSATRPIRRWFPQEV